MCSPPHDNDITTERENARRSRAAAASLPQVPQERVNRGQVRLHNTLQLRVQHQKRRLPREAQRDFTTQGLRRLLLCACGDDGRKVGCRSY